MYLSLSIIYNFINHFAIFNWDPNYNKYIEITDVTDDIFIQDLSLNFNESGILELNYFNNNSAVNQVGSWEWAGPEMKPGVVSGEIFTEGINTIPLKDSLEFNPYFIHVEKLRPNKLEIRIRTIPEVNYNLERFIETYRFTFKGNWFHYEVIFAFDFCLRLFLDSLTTIDCSTFSSVEQLTHWTL